MKQLFLLPIILVGLLLTTACEEKDIEVFNNERFVYFEKFWCDEIYPGTQTADSTDVTFFFNAPDNNTLNVNLNVMLAGRKLDQDQTFSLRVVEDMTTALPDEYTLQDSYTFRALPLDEYTNCIQDTIQIQLNRTERLQSLEDGYRLVVEIVPNDILNVGQYERSRAIIHVSKEPVRPDWWDEEVTASLLGTYSATKYKTFLLNIPGAFELDKEMIEQEPDRARKLAMDFKEWLDKNPTLDEDGYPMEVPV